MLLAEGVEGREVDSFRALDLLGAQVDDVSKAARRGEVGRRLVRQRRRLGSKRVEQDLRRAGLTRPAGEAAKIGEVADAPAVARAQRVKLDGPAPCALRRGPAR